MRRRGTSLVEMLLVVVLTAIIMGSVALLYGFTFRTIAKSTTHYAVSEQSRQVADLIAKTVSESVSCTTVSFGSSTALKCVMPATGIGSDVQGNPKDYAPLTTARTGRERYGAGKRIWYYMSNSSGNPSASGALLWSAERSDDTTITSADVVRNVTYYYGGAKHRYPLVTNVAFVVDAAQKTVVINVTASSLVREERSGTSEFESSRKHEAPLSRRVYWRNWRL